MLYRQYTNHPTVEELRRSAREVVENPQAVIDHFFDTYDLSSSHEKVWEMLKQTFSSPDVNDWTATERANYILFYEQLITLLIADYVLFLEMQKGKV
jgi:hypothetical protein